MFKVVFHIKIMDVTVYQSNYFPEVENQYFYSSAWLYTLSVYAEIPFA